MMQVTPQQLAEMLKSPNPPRLLDVRQPEEHVLVSLPDSMLVPLGELLQRVDELEDWRDEEIVVYCHHGIRSAQAVSQLRFMGFEKVYNLSGGIDRWSTEVDPQTPRY